MDLTKKKTSFAFNRICINFLKSIKDKDDNIKKIIKKNYKVIDKTNEEYIQFFIDEIKPLSESFEKIDIDIDELCDSQQYLDVELLPGINLGNLFEIFSEDRLVILSYVFTLYLYAYLYADITPDNYLSIDALLNKTLRILHSIDSDKFVEKELDDVLDDTLKQVLQHISSFKIQMLSDMVDDDVGIKNTDTLGNDVIDNLLKGSQIGDIAKSIYGEIQSDNSIDFSSLQDIKDPSELLNMNNLFGSGSNNLIGNIINKVGGSISKKMANGEINQEALISDAFNLIGKINNGNTNETNMMSELLSGLMNNIGSGNIPVDIPGMDDIGNLGDLQKIQDLTELQAASVTVKTNKTDKSAKNRKNKNNKKIIVK